jgi:TIR domain
MAGAFQYDVFLSHSSKDKGVVRAIAERLRVDGVKVWFDEWVLKPGDSIPTKIEEGLERALALVLCMSANAFSSELSTVGLFRHSFKVTADGRHIHVSQATEAEVHRPVREREGANSLARLSFPFQSAVIAIRS